MRGREAKQQPETQSQRSQTFSPTAARLCGFCLIHVLWLFLFLVLLQFSVTLVLPPSVFSLCPRVPCFLSLRLLSRCVKLVCLECVSGFAVIVSCPVFGAFSFASRWLVPAVLSSCVSFPHHPSVYLGLCLLLDGLLWVHYVLLHRPPAQTSTGSKKTLRQKSTYLQCFVFDMK